MEPVTSKAISVTVNGASYEREIDVRRLLVHFIRDELDLTGTHIGCDTGNCGACTVIVDGLAVKSCMLLAVQADGTSIETVESPAGGPAFPRVTAIHAAGPWTPLFPPPAWALQPAKTLATRRVSSGSHRNHEGSFDSWPRRDGLLPAPSSRW